MEKLLTSIAAKFGLAKVSTMKISNFKNKLDTKPKGVAKNSEKRPMSPVKNPKNIVVGMSGKTIRFVIGAIIESVPIL